MKQRITTLRAGTRWQVPFADDGFWRSGIYKPEFHSPDEIDELEKHSCPELFLCCGGTMGLLVSDGTREEVLYLEPGQALEVTDYHNGFCVDPKGWFFVVERTDFATEYIDRITGRPTRTVIVGDP